MIEWEVLCQECDGNGGGWITGHTLSDWDECQACKGTGFKLAPEEVERLALREALRAEQSE